MMLIDVQIAFGVNREIERGVLRQQREHMVKEPDAGGEAALARAVEREFQMDLGLGSFAIDGRSARH
jgi:hypothetical protein